MNSRYYSSTGRQAIRLRLILIIVVPLLVIMITWLYFNRDQGKQDRTANTPIVENLQIPNENDIDKQPNEKPSAQNPGDFVENQNQESKNNLIKSDPDLKVGQIDKVVLPSLNESDELFKQDILNLSPGFTPLLNIEGIIKHWVIAINDFSQNLRPYKHFRQFKLSEPFLVETSQAGIYMAEAGYQRYDFIASAVHAADVEKVVNLLEKYRPLLQQAFADFGYPEAYQMDDIIKKAISNVLQAPIIEDKIKLIKPAVRYKFADNMLESLSPVQKQMIRMGPENTRIIQAKLRQFVEAMSNR